MARQVDDEAEPQTRKERVADLAEAQCTDHEIAGDVWGSLEAFDREVIRAPALRKLIDDGRARGRARLKLAQYQRAIANGKDSDRMLVWLGKQYLGQREPDREGATEVVQAAETWMDILKLAETPSPDNVLDLVRKS